MKINKKEKIFANTYVLWHNLALPTTREMALAVTPKCKVQLSSLKFFNFSLKLDCFTTKKSFL